MYIYTALTYDCKFTIPLQSNSPAKALLNSCQSFTTKYQISETKHYTDRMKLPSCTLHHENRKGKKAEYHIKRKLDADIKRLPKQA